MIDLTLGFVTGLLASLHCVSMCGGFVAAYSLRATRSASASSGLVAVMQPAVLLSHFLYNAGRLTTYVLLGGVMGLVGSFVAASGQLLGVQGLASILAGFFMILLGLRLGRWIPYTLLLQPAWISQFSHISRWGQQLASRTMTLGTFPLGLLLGFMPCGPLYAMEINAAGTGNISQGMLMMLAFGLGTVPMLLGFGLVSNVIGRHLPRRLFQVAALVVVLLGLLTLLRGLALNGAIPHSGLW